MSNWKNFFVNVAASIFVIVAIRFLSKFKIQKPVKKKSMSEITREVLEQMNEKQVLRLNPAIRDKVRKLLKKWFDSGLFVRITEDGNFRTFQQQQEIYNKGRDKNGNVIDKSKVVTNAKPGQSYHNYGLAFDIIPIVNGKGTYNFDFSKLKPDAISLGFKWGGDWKKPKTDNPHFEYTFGKSEKELLALYNSGKRTGEYVNIA